MSIPSLTHCSQCLLCIMRKREGPAAFTRLCSACSIQYPHRSLTFPHFVRLSLKLHRRVRPTAGRRRTKCLWSLPCVKYDSPHCQWLSFCQMKGVVCASCPPTGLSERLKGSSLEGGKGRCRGWSQSPHQPLKADQQQQQHHCTLPQEGTHEEIMCTWLKLSIRGNKGGIFKRKMTAAAPKLTSYAESVAWIMDEDFLTYWFLVLPCGLFFLSASASRFG